MKPLDDPLRGLRPAPPPAGLRAATLAAAERALAAGAPAPALEPDRPGLIDRLWASRPLRWAWLAAVAALLAGHLALRPAPRMVADGAADPPAAPVRLTSAGVGGTLGDWSRWPSRNAALLVGLERPARPAQGDLR